MEKKYAFTLVELTVVCAILVIIAATIVPNLVAVTRSRSLKDLEGNVARLPAEARNEAVKSQTPVRLRVSGTTLVMERVPATGEPAQVKMVDLGDSLTVDAAQQNGKTTDAGSWVWMVYPDGSADSGGVEFTEGQAQKSLVLSANGGVQWIDGPLPDSAQDTWPAGQLLPHT